VRCFLTANKEGFSQGGMLMQDPLSVQSEASSAKTSETVDDGRVLEPSTSCSLPASREPVPSPGPSRESDERLRSDHPLFYENSLPSRNKLRVAATSESGTDTPILSSRSRDVLKLVEEIILHVNQLTQRRVHGLCVKIIHNKIILEGTSQTFHIKQLAQQAAMKNGQSLEVANRIVVADKSS
jgi:hypothetical protein